MEIKFFKKDKNFKKKSSEINPDSCWVFIFYIGFFLTLAAFAFGFYLFTQINRKPVLSTSGANKQVETVEKDRIKKVLEYFSLREQKSDQILNSPSPIVDPSL